MWNKLKQKRYWIPLQVVLALILGVSLMFVGVQVEPKDITSDTQTVGVGQKVYTIGVENVVYAAGTPDYACDGVADDVQFQLAINALPAAGGKIVALAGNYTFIAPVTRAINSVTIEGMGFSTFISRDGVNPIFTVGVQSNWTFINIRFDAGGVNDTGSSEVTYENVDIGGTHWAYDTSIDIGGASWDIPSGRTTTLIVAASDAYANSIAQADYLCNGTADEVEINAAINALPNQGGKVQLTEGNFNIAAPIVLYRDLPNFNLWLNGMGLQATLITLANNSNCNMMENITGVNNSWWKTVSNMMLNGNRANQANGHGIYSDPAGAGNLYDARYHNVFTTQMKEDGFHFESGTWGTYITNCLSEYNDGDGIYLRGDECYIYGFHSSDNGGDGIHIRGTEISVSDARIANSDEYGLFLEAAFRCSVTGGSISNWGLDGALTSAIYFSSDSVYNTIIGISIDGDATADSLDGINIRGDYNTITGNTILDVFQYPINISSWATYNVVYSNILRRGTNSNVGLYDHDFGSIQTYGNDWSKQASDLLQDVLAVSATHVRSNEDLSVATPITFTIDAQPDVPRTLSGHFDAHANITAYTIEIKGTDGKGWYALETLTEADGWDWETSKAYATITSIQMTARTGTGVGDTMDIGITDVLGLSNIIDETNRVYKIKKNNANATVAAGQVDITNDTYDMAVIGLGAADDFTIWYKSILNTVY